MLMTIAMIVLVFVGGLILWRWLIVATAYKVEGTRVLVCSVGGDGPHESQPEDAGLYRANYRHVVEAHGSKDEILRLIGTGGFHIVHVLQQEESQDETSELTNAAAEARVRMILFGSDRSIQHVPRGLTKPSLSLFFTIERKGPVFSKFLSLLVGKVAQGALPSFVFASIAPPIPDPKYQATVPAILHLHGGPNVRLLP